jgi:hypothetical protein
MRPPQKEMEKETPSSRRLLLNLQLHNPPHIPLNLGNPPTQKTPFHHPRRYRFQFQRFFPKLPKFPFLKHPSYRSFTEP